MASNSPWPLLCVRAGSKQLVAVFSILWSASSQPSSLETLNRAESRPLTPLDSQESNNQHHEGARAHPNTARQGFEPRVMIYLVYRHLLLILWTNPRCSRTKRRRGLPRPEACSCARWVDLHVGDICRAGIYSPSLRFRRHITMDLV